MVMGAGNPASCGGHDSNQHLDTAHIAPVPSHLTLCESIKTLDRLLSTDRISVA